MTITTITEARVTGSFSGTGACISNTDEESSFGVEDGFFDLPVLPSTNPVESMRRSRSHVGFSGESRK